MRDVPGRSEVKSGLTKGAGTQATLACHLVTLSRDHSAYDEVPRSKEQIRIIRQGYGFWVKPETAATNIAPNTNPKMLRAEKRAT